LRQLLISRPLARLRPGEAVKLGREDVQPERGLIRVVQGKGKKDRCVMRSEVLLKMLRAYMAVRGLTPRLDGPARGAAPEAATRHFSTADALAVGLRFY
jgi:integrase/recombinase XerD